MDGGPGKDQLEGDQGNDYLSGGGGDDKFFFVLGADEGNDTITDMTPGDVIYVFSSTLGNVSVGMGVGGTDITFKGGTIHPVGVDPATIHIAETHGGQTDVTIDILLP